MGAKQQRARRVRVLVVDDHPMVREGTEARLNATRDIEVVGTAEDGATALRLMAELRPEVLVMDLRLPDVSGIVVIQQVRSTWPDAKVLVLTGHTEAYYLEELSQLGIHGFLQKTATGPEIIAAVRALASDQPGPSLPPSSNVADASMPLTCREREVLQLLVTGRRNADIALALCISVKTVEFHVGNIFKKLGAESRTEAIFKAQQRRLT